MAQNYGPKVPTSGLVLLWDAADKNSYPGSGTTIYDVSGNGNHGTLYNGVGYNTANSGVLTFDGSNDYVSCGTPNLASSNYTVVGAARYSGSTRGRMINATNNNWLLGHWGTTTQNYFAEGWVSSVAAGPSDTEWRIYAGIGRGTYSLYVNNVLNVSNTNGSQGPNGITVGTAGSEYSTGQFSFVYVYNRVLSATEITQIYNVQKSRFGL